MGITRRQFLFFIPAAGSILPFSFVRTATVLPQASSTTLPDNTTKVLFAHDWGDGEWELNLGDPREQPPIMTVGEYINRYWDGDVEDYAINWGYEDGEIDLDTEMEPWVVLESWARTDSPNAKAFRLLQDIDLGHDFHGADATGKIIFTDGAHPGNDYLGASVPDMESLSLLQRHLNHLGTGIRVKFSQS